MKPATKKRFPFPALMLCLICTALLIGAAWYMTGDLRQYRTGLSLMETGQYDLALEIFESLPEYEPASGKIPETKYQMAQVLLKEERYEEAAGIFSSLENYADSAEKAGNCYYQLATSARLAKDYGAAQNYYVQAGEYSDAHLQSQRMLYTLGHENFLEGHYSDAAAYFAQLEGSQSDYGNPHFQTLAEAVEFLDQQRLNLNDRITFHIDAKADAEFYETLRNIFPCQYYYANYYEPDKLVTIAGIHYYPGENILYALKVGNTSNLTDEEMQVLALAQEVVEQAQAECATEYETELWLHDWLCNQVDYESPNMEIKRKEYIQLRELSCIGAMLDGVANCQGYADAFYLLGNMAGLEVGRVLGDTGGGHIWNTIVLDGTRYIVDVTFDDFSDMEQNGWGYTYFNAFWDPAVYDPYGNDDAGLPITTNQDLTNTYYAHENLIFTDLDDAADSLVSQHVDGKQPWTYAVIQGDNVNHDNLDAAISNKLWKYARYERSFSWIQWLDFYGEYTYISICWES